MKRIILFVFLMIHSLISKCQNDGSLISQHGRCTALVYENGKLGTGFFVHDSTFIYFVTAQHVSSFTSLNTQIVYTDTTDKPIVANLRDMVVDTISIIWTNHPVADVSTFLVKPEWVAKHPNLFYFPTRFINDTLNAPYREQELVLIGYPLGLGAGKYLSPITKRSYAASGLIDLPRADTKKVCTFFLLEEPGAQGFSGGPIFNSKKIIIEGPWFVAPADDSKEEDGNFICEGILHGVIPDNTGGKFSMVTPSYFIIDLIHNFTPKYSGKLIYYHRNGLLWSEVYYLNGLPYTVISNYSSTGIAVEKGSLINGNGTRNVYDESGKLKFIHTYKKSKLVNTQTF